MKTEVYSIIIDVEGKHWWFVARRRVLFPLIQEAMKGCEDDLVVDIGCGTGGTIASLLGRYNCIGIDSNEKAIEFGREAYPECVLKFGQVPEDIKDTADGTGLYMLLDVLEHIEDDRVFLEDVVANCRPGAHILITVPAHQALWSQHDETVGHKRRYEMDAFQNLWRGLPVKPRLVTSLNSRLYPIIKLIRTVTNRLGITVGKHQTDFAMVPEPFNFLLKKIFATESKRIHVLLENPHDEPCRKGVGLMALLRRE